MGPLRIRVSAPSHVHVGNIDVTGYAGRRFGTIGFALESPRLELTIDSGGGGFECRGCGDEVSGLAMKYMKIYSSIYDCNPRIGVSIGDHMPPHVGLGFTTALALSIGYAYSVLCNKRFDAREAAARAGRSLVSALGLYSFTHGGFIVDGGFVEGSGKPPPLIFRSAVPRDVAIVVALPERPIKKVLEIKSREEEILRSMPPMDERLASANALTTLMGIIPAAAEGDWATVARLIYKLNRGLGEYWGSAQGGIYCCSESEEVLRRMLESGAWGGAQSSWGPTVYSLTSRDRAGEVAGAARRALDSLGGGRVWVTSVDNEGARILVERG